MKITLYGNRAGHNFRRIPSIYGGTRIYIHIPGGREIAIWFGRG